MNKTLRIFMDMGYLEEFLGFQIRKKIRNYQNSLLRYVWKSDIWKSRRIIENQSDYFFKYRIHSIIGNFDNFSTVSSNKDTHEILKEADFILDKGITVLGSSLINLTDINWHKDYKSGFIWGKGKFYKDYVQVDLRNNADVKIPREMSRSHFLLVVGEAYLLTKDEKYSKFIIDIILDWIIENPYLHSINWGCPMDVSIRAVNWIYALNMIIGSESIDDSSIKTVFKSIYLHGKYIYTNIERYLYNNGNHTVSNLLGLFIIGKIFENDKLARKWQDFGHYQMMHEIRAQVLPSGVIYDKTINYIRLTQEMFIVYISLLQKANYYIPPDILYRIKKTIIFTLNYIKPDGTYPVIGDQDDGRFLPFSFNNNLDHEYILSIGAVLFKSELFKSYSNRYYIDNFFLFGNDSKKIYNGLKVSDKKLSSSSFDDAGFYIMRKNNDYLFINNSGISKHSDLPNSLSSHTHSDLLSFELVVNGKNILIDSGTYGYTSNSEERNFFRSTKMHNTVVIDKVDQHQLSDSNLFAYKKIAIPETLKWYSDENEDIFIGKHNGYESLKEPITHYRKIIFNKTNRYWEIIDWFEGSGTHIFEWFLHFDNEVKLEKLNKKLYAVNSGVICEITFDFAFDFELIIESGFISKSYGCKSQAKIAIVRVEQDLNGLKNITKIRDITNG